MRTLGSDRGEVTWGVFVMQEKGEQSSDEPYGLADSLRRHREDILRDWERAVAEHQPDGLTREALLRDYLPGFLERVADVLEHPPDEGRLAQLVPDEHTLRRLEAGLEPDQVTLEFGLLRHCIQRRLAQVAGAASFAQWALLHESIDQGILRATALYTNMRDRMLKALERVSEAVVVSQDIDSFLSRLLGIMLECSVSVDSAALLLNEKGEFRLRAAVGLGAREALESDVRLPLDTGLSGQVAAERSPRLVRMASTHPQLRSDLVRRLGLRAVYSVPLLQGERLIGVAHMGSRTLFDFTASDKQLFRTMMTRALNVIVRAELVEREHAARADAQRLRSLVDTMVEACPVGLCLMDRELRFIYINDTLARLNGHTVARHLGRPLREMAPGWIATLLEPHFLRVLEEGRPVCNHEFTSPPWQDSPEQHWLCHYYPVRNTDGLVDGLGCVLVNITQQKRVEAELRRAGELRERLIGVVGHDLRNPLNAISISAGLLQRQEDLEEDARRAVERIRTSAARMARMLNDILDFARSTMEGGLPVHRERVNLHELCRSALEELQVAYANQRMELDARGDGWGWWDPDRLTQVVGNLVSNAVQHGRKGTPVRVEVRDEGNDVLLAVHNEGEPIAPELLPSLFQPFRHGATGKASSRSVGLGLYIVQQVARAHGGEAQVSSSEHGHTVFTVRLPRGG
ncbi:ATP-binding protein [Cystobacter fuscus]|uniref:ATP-binding protein n=1 Tax=Cystobacter fuscus TaxID=43 RepID=UPI002B318BD9|nr:PAS domain-containing protein [Cystobacter fuscus]